ncbi:Kinesin-like protein KIN-8B [Ancistrocladus abbreviatus]
MPSIRAPATKKTTTLTVAVRCRPSTELEHQRGRDIVRVIDDKEVLVLDPDLSKDYLDIIQHRTKERKYSFDYAFGPDRTNLDCKVDRDIVYIAESRDVSYAMLNFTGLMTFSWSEVSIVLVSSVALVDEETLVGLATSLSVWAQTFGKTHTMVGNKDDPGVMVLSLHTVFDFIKTDNSPDDFEVSCSYLEVYNEVIYDLLEKSSGHLELREDPEQGVTVAGLRSIKVHSADKILELLNLGNSRRKTESTEANATSSRSHAVLEITVKRKQMNKYCNQILKGKLALVDLAGSERASETNSGGQKLRDGANINRSLLALANCINALGKHQKKGLAYVPYRNSKLTRILKDGLSGNSQTIMVATISPSRYQYHHTVNTLKYADRAKEIKTHIQKNIGTIDTHVSDYQKMIDSLQIEVFRLRKELAEKESQPSVKPPDKAADEELSWLNSLSHEISENVQERINLQKALFELKETNLHNHSELQHLDDAIAKQQATEKDGVVVKTLTARRQVILDNIRDNDEAGVHYQKEIEANEKQRCQLQGMIDEAIKNNGNKTYLCILSHYRLLGMANTELQFEIAMRDQVIHNQREAQRNLWNLLMGLGLDQQRILEHAAKEGITIEDWTMTPSPELSDKIHSPNPLYDRHDPRNSPCIVQPYSGPTCIVHCHGAGHSRSFSRACWELDHASDKEEQKKTYSGMPSSYFPSYTMLSRNEHWHGGWSNRLFFTPDRHTLQKSYPGMKAQSSFTRERFISSLSFNPGTTQQPEDPWKRNIRRYLHGIPPSANGDSTMHHGGMTRGLFAHKQQHGQL